MWLATAARRGATGALLAVLTTAFVLVPSVPPAPSAAPAPPSALQSVDIGRPAVVVPPMRDFPERASRAVRRPAPAPVRPPARCVDGAPAARGERALSSLRADWRRVGVTVRFRGPRSGTLGETLVGNGAVTVYVRPCAAESDALLRHVIAHELGHAWDVTRLTPAQRRAYQRFRGIPAAMPWFGCSGCADFATPAGDFAETYAQWLRGAADSRSELARAATPAELAALARQFFGG